MDREEIIRMAREAGFSERDAMGRTAFLGNSYDIERFAALVAAAEREACAKLLDDWKKHNWTFDDCATVIRARGNT